MKNILKKIIDNFEFPECLSEIRYIKPSKIPLDLIARFGCLHCGLWSRSISCPPYLWQTYKQFKTIQSTVKFIRSFDTAIVFVWKNDGTKSWKVNKEELSHIEFKIKKGRQLKGTEAGQSRELTRLTAIYRAKLRKSGYKCFGLIQGPCNLCAFKCENRDNPPCVRGCLPSLEAIGIDVYKMLENLDIDYEFPVINSLTAVTMMLVKEK